MLSRAPAPDQDPDLALDLVAAALAALPHALAPAPALAAPVATARAAAAALLLPERAEETNLAAEANHVRAAVADPGPDLALAPLRRTRKIVDPALVPSPSK